MGEIADMMLDGTLCEGCGVYMGEAGNGYPRYCSYACAEARGAPKETAQRYANPIAKDKVECLTCGKRVKIVGLANHVKDAHQSKGVV